LVNDYNKGLKHGFSSYTTDKQRILDSFKDASIYKDLLMYVESKGMGFSSFFRLVDVKKQRNGDSHCNLLPSVSSSTNENQERIENMFLANNIDKVTIDSCSRFSESDYMQLIKVLEQLA
jgi:hypothetical protein